jgi:DNA-directed RNA polymerase omega subunit
MKVKTLSRGPELDVDKCTEAIGNRFDLVLVASIRAREISRQHKNSDNRGNIKSPLTALLEIQEGKIQREYLKRIR